jgi:hypothetical protein
MRAAWLAVRAALCCAWLLCSAAHASDQQVIVDAGKRMSGIVHTSGHDVPLLRALEQILPASYSVNAPNAGAWAQAPVSWRAGASIEHVLGEILSIDPSLQARVDTDLHLVTVTAHAVRTSSGEPALTAAMPAAAPAPVLSTVKAAPTAPPLLVASVPPSVLPSVPPSPPVSPAPQQPTRTPSPAVSAHAATQVLPTPDADPVALSAAATPAPEQTEWQMRMSDGSVRNALARWASEAGWQFIWDVPTDFEVDATATIHGTLEQALRQVTGALAGSQVPIQVVLYQRNRVMRVVPKGAS